MMTAIGKTLDGAFKAFSSALGVTAGALLVACALAQGERRVRIKELEKENKELREMVQ